MNTARANITAPKAAVARGTPTGAAATLQSVTSEWVELDWAGRRVRIGTPMAAPRRPGSAPHGVPARGSGFGLHVA
ncbi:MAG: hypothetical protein IPI20_14215 [Rhodoferax sp.]|nr:hypothetical protein [Rhodoferax sp.]